MRFDFRTLYIYRPSCTRKSHPVLLPASILPFVTNASQAAPPVALISLIETNETVLVPLLSLRVACTPAVLLFKVTRLPDVPDALNALTVCVVPEVNRIDAGDTVLVISANVLLPLIIKVPAPPWLSVPKVLPPPAALPTLKVLDTALFIDMAEPDALTVAFDEVDICHAVPDAKTMTDELAIESVRTLLFDEENVPVVSVIPFRSKEPLVSVNALVEPSVIASCSRQVPPTPLSVTGQSNVRPLDVIVLTPDVEAKVSVDAELAVIPLESVRLPKIVPVPGA